MPVVRLLLAPLLLASSFVSHAQSADPPPLTGATFMELDAMLPSLRGRPNEEYRVQGLKAYQQRHYDEAIQRFEMASGYADKYSQHYLSLMHWHGVGTPVDRVRAYIWSDLAAERGNPRLLAIREKMWTQLSTQEQARVPREGQAYYARHGDDVAKPRAEAEFRRFARDMTGSRVGYRNQRFETGGGPVNGVFLTEVGSNAAAYAVSVAGSPDELYGKEGGLKRLDTYWQEQDRLLDGNVEVGEMEMVRRDDRRRPSPRQDR
ncbi:hypothetical protein [Lysobacter arvi]|uniref:Sel1 repeat family protein n=1 Tax=Lysobacter arvi TaxID=3038776 RepID=A0ABU1CHY0_9GAMM|nr:hypothetical protein [Lysobacter arvi]MDR0184563.1 hypothetical protein [Lysobacter arvi]